MDPKHRSVLQRNRVTLVVDLKPSELYDGLLEKGIFTQDMIDEIKVDFQHFYQDMTVRRALGHQYGTGVVKGPGFWF